MTEKNIKSEAGILSANIAVIVTFLYLISVAMIFLVTGDKKLVIFANYLVFIRCYGHYTYALH